MKQISIRMLGIILVTLAVQVSSAQITNSVTVVDSFTRKYDFTAYAANDVVTDSLSKMFIFNDVVATKGFGGIINSALLTVGDTANTANGAFTLLLFADTVTTAADNAAWTTGAYYNTRLVGEIQFTLKNNGTAQNYSFVNGNLVNFQCSAGKKKLYGILLAQAAFKPTVNQKFIIKLGIVRN